MNIEIVDKHIKMLADFRRYALPSGPPPIELLHDHSYPEIHIAAYGDIKITTSSAQYTLKSGSAAIIPPGMYHCLSASDPGTKWIAFLTTHNCRKFVQKKFPDEFINEFFTKIDSNPDGKHSDSIVNHVLFMCNELLDEKMYSCIPEKDYLNEINQFMCCNYNRNIHISDLAYALNVSETHAQRLIKKYTGKTFGESLLFQRMLVADNLINYSDMTAQEIAVAVGYSTYSGFWKAYKKYKGDSF